MDSPKTWNSVQDARVRAEHERESGDSGNIWDSATPPTSLERDVERMLELIPKPKTWRSRLFGTELVRVFIISDRLVAFRISNIQHHRRSDLR